MFASTNSRSARKPTRARRLVTEGQWNLVHDVVGTAAIGEGKDSDLERRILFIVRRDGGLDAAWIDLDQVIEPGLATVRLQPVLLLKEPPLLIATRARTAARERHHDQQAHPTG